MKWTSSFSSVMLATSFLAGTLCAQESQNIPNTGQTITPTAPKNARYELLNPD
jgi:hypothetical protein